MRSVSEVVADLETRLPGIMLHWQREPADFMRDVLRMEPQKWQTVLMKAVSNARFGFPNDGDECKRRIAVKSGTGVGKTAGVAGLILWHLAVFPDSKIPCTAPTSPQIKAVLWPEARKWVQNIPNELREWFPFDVQTDRIVIHENFAVARTAREETPESFQGFHAKNIMLIADEASGVPDAVFLAGQGVMSEEGAITILIGNPTRPSGWFYDAFNSDARKYFCMTVSCVDSERVTRSYIEDMREKHGENSFEYKVRVLGEFHLEDSGFVIARSLVQDAVKRDVQPDTDYIIWGVDVSAGLGDKSAIAKRQGNVLLEPVKTYGGLNVMQFVDRTVDLYLNTPVHMRPDEICVDVIGVGQGYVAQLRRELKQFLDTNALRIKAVNVSERKAAGERYVSLRVELWAKAKEWFERQACKVAEDKELFNEMCSVEWEINDSNGKWQLVDKKAGGHSPDRADAFVLTFAGRKVEGFTKGKARNNRFARPSNMLYGIGEASYLTR